MLRSIKIRQYLAAMQALGYSPAAVLAGSGLEAPWLSNPSFTVELEQCHAVVANIIRLTGNPSIGLDIGQRSQVTDLGIVGYAMTSSRTLRQAIVIWLQYASSAQGWPVRTALLDEPDRQVWGIRGLAPDLPPALLAFYWEEVIALGYDFARVCVGENYQLKEVRFAYPVPTDAARYEALFQCPVQFGASECRVEVLAPALDAPLRGNDEVLNQLCLAHCGQVLQQTAKNGPTTMRLRSLLLRYRGVFPTIEEAAAQLGVSPRTLRRRLTDEQTGYQQLLDEFRCDLAQQYLANGLKPKEIGYLLGFKHPDAFRQAFKSWTGRSTKAYRTAQ